MKKLFILSIFICYSILINAQTVTVVNDQALNGQLKRMVFLKWNDWKPNPNGWQGILFWRFTWNRYYTGTDRRPYKIGGVVDQDLAEAYIYTDKEKKMTDTVKDVAKDEALNYAAKSGGVLDYPYSFYYKQIFNDLRAQIDNVLMKLVLTNGAVYKAVNNDKYYQDYKNEFLPYMEERIKTVHESFGEKGDRILSYIDIHREFEQKNEHILNIIRLYKKLTPLQAARRPRPVEIHTNTDREIRLKIERNLNF